MTGVKKGGLEDIAYQHRRPDAEPASGTNVLGETLISFTAKNKLGVNIIEKRSRAVWWVAGVQRDVGRPYLEDS